MSIQIAALASQHIPAVLESCTDWKELSQYGSPYWRPRSEAELQRKITSTSGPQLSTEYNFVLQHPNNRLIGECSIHSIDWRNRVAQIGVCVWNPENRRLGYGKHAVEFCLDWATNYLGICRVEAWVLEDNKASCRLFERLGFSLEGTLRCRYIEAGKRHDVHVYAKLQSV